MTAEIAVANKSAIALAADSKVTISGGHGTKTYDTVNKVFKLSKVHPVGIMIFGNAEFMDYPWETIIKLYRKGVGKKSFGTVEAWSDDFLQFLSTFGNVEDAHKSSNIRRVVASSLAEIEEVAYSEAHARRIPIPSDQYHEIFLNRIEIATAESDECDNWEPKRKAKALVKKYSLAIAKGVIDVIGEDADKRIGKAALHFAVKRIVKAELSPRQSGFVIAGFGDDEMFPTLYQFGTDGYIGDRIKVAQDPPFDISRSMNACIRAFAQKDMVQQFMNGIDQYMLQTTGNLINRALADSAIAVLDEFGLAKHKTDSVRDRIRTGALLQTNQILEKIDAVSAEVFSSPVVEMVSLLPKDELAHLAESLVAITSLKRRVSTDAETVGGPIDVALISKSDGFVWIKRKHYFASELNPQFIRTYMDDIQV